MKWSIFLNFLIGLFFFSLQTDCSHFFGNDRSRFQKNLINLTPRKNNPFAKRPLLGKQPFSRQDSRDYCPVNVDQTRKFIYLIYQPIEKFNENLAALELSLNELQSIALNLKKPTKKQNSDTIKKVLKKLGQMHQEKQDLPLITQVIEIINKIIENDGVEATDLRDYLTNNNLLGNDYLNSISDALLAKISEYEKLEKISTDLAHSSNKDQILSYLQEILDYIEKNPQKIFTQNELVFKIIQTFAKIILQDQVDLSTLKKILQEKNLLTQRHLIPINNALFAKMSEDDQLRFLKEKPALSAGAFGQSSPKIKREARVLGYSVYSMNETIQELQNIKNLWRITGLKKQANDTQQAGSEKPANFAADQLSDVD